MIDQENFFSNIDEDESGEEITINLYDKILENAESKTEIELEQNKVISLKTNEYIFDVNTLFLPFMPEYRGERINKIEVQQITQQKKCNIVVRGDVELGVPTVYDKLTLAALQRIFIKQRMINGQLHLKKTKITTEDRTIQPITVTTLARELGYLGNISANTKANICDSIRRLSFTTYVSSNDRTFDHKNKEYIMKAEEGTHLIKYKMLTVSEEEKELRRRRGKTKSNNAKSKEKYEDTKERIFEGMVQIMLDEVVYKTMASDQILYYANKQIAKVKHPLSKSIYMLILKLAGNNKEYKISLNKLLTYFPMKPGHTEGKSKDLIKRALNKLSDSKVCTISYLKNDVIHFSFKKGAKTVIKHDYMTNKFNTFGELLKGYMDLGLTQEEVFALNMQKQRYYEALVRYVTIKNFYNKIDNTRKYVLNYIENEYPIDEKYYSKIE